ncbi:MAG: hypothetical protein HY897_19000 [Deltaproteobacteria bacterium]|nr:hypothetical protein [Deltaproteobacteria bacterium]
MSNSPLSAAAVLVAAAVAAGGCVVESREVAEGVESFEIRVSYPGDLGDEAANRPVATRDFVLNIRAVGAEGDPPYEVFNRKALLSVLYGGRLQPLQEVGFSGGVAADVFVTVERVFGRAIFWIEDSIEAGPSYAAGASVPIVFPNPSIADVQFSNEEEAPFTSALSGYQLRSGGQETIKRRVVVTSVTNSGFYMTDLDGPGNGSNSLFVFNYSRPEGVAAGDNLLWFSGTVAEHLGTTQVTFPSWEVCYESWCDGAIPSPFVITQETTYKQETLEALESGLVQIGPVQIQDVNASKYERETFDQYGQYKVRIFDKYGDLGKDFNVVSRESVAEFDPRDHAFEEFTYIRGVLSELNFNPGVTSWIINVRDRCDICGPEYCPCGE